MSRNIIHNLILLCFLLVLSADSISPLFEKDNILIELTDIADEEEQEELCSNCFESDLNVITTIEPQFLILNSTYQTTQFVLSKKYSFTIPTPPPEFVS
mgnify:CR=1 FL=1